MIFLGDIAAPNLEHSQNLDKIFETHSDIFSGKMMVANLEGMVCNDHQLSDPTPVLFNHASAVQVLAKHQTKAIGLANNHTLDLPKHFPQTKRELEANSIAFSGAANSKKEASEPIFFKKDGKEIIIINACWDFLLYHQKNPTNNLFVNTINENAILDEVIFQKKQNPKAKIFVFLHWSFDLETLPFPMYRQWSKQLIDSGVNAVVGCHSHCVQGGEKYKDGYIVYGLGNFYLPWNTFANGKLKFADFSKMQMVFDLNLRENKAICHWFNYQENGHRLRHIASEPFETSEILKEYSPYQNMTDKEYLSYFKKNRRKKFLIPIYKNYLSVQRNNFYTSFLKNRGRFARTLAKYKIRNWQN